MAGFCLSASSTIPNLVAALLGTPYVRFALFGILTVASIIACVGLWLLAPWGAVLWLVIVAADALIYFLLPNLGIISITILLLNAGLVSIYLGMLLQVRRRRKPRRRCAKPASHT
jgi:uncharacterized membrane protein